MDSLLRDVRYAVRALAAQPGWTIAVALCLAVATGANSTAFSIVNALLLRPLPFAEPDRLAMVAVLEPGAAQTRWRLRRATSRGWSSPSSSARTISTCFV
jgi:hypothetical protein